MRVCLFGGMGIPGKVLVEGARNRHQNRQDKRKNDGKVMLGGFELQWRFVDVEGA